MKFVQKENDMNELLGTGLIYIKRLIFRIIAIHLRRKSKKSVRGDKGWFI